MSRLLLEDGFEYNIKRALEEYFNEYDNPDEALDNFDEGDNDDFVNALYERSSSYTDLQELAILERNKRIGKTLK